MVIDISTTCILEQPDFEYLEGVPNLQTHQKESKVTANSWRSDVRDSIFAVNNSILSYNDHFQSIYGFLSGFAKSMAKDADARQNLIEGLKDLKKVITIQKETAELVKKKMTDFLTNITTHKSHLNSDSTEIETRYEGDKGMIHDIQASIDAQDEAMNKDLTMMAAGSVGVVTGILTISFGVFMWIETAGGSTFVILAGIGITTGGAIAVGIGADDYNKKAHVKADLLKELAGIKTEITVAKLLRSGVQTLIQHIEVIVQVTDKLCEAWGQLDQDYGSLIETLNNTDAEAAAFVVQVNLDTAKKQWDRLAGDAELLKRNFLEPPKINVDSLKSAKPGLLIMPSMNVMSMYNTTEVSARVASGEPQVMKPLQPPAALTRNTHLKTWLDQTSQALLSFEHLLQSAKDSTSAPADVIAKNNKLMACGDVANKSAIVFLAAVEMLSESSDELERTAQLPDSVIAFIARTVFKKLSSQLSDTRHVGSTAVSDFSTMYEAQAETSVSINGWMVKMKNEKEADEKQMAEFEKQRDEAEQEKEKSKQDFWWCFLGPIACAAVAIEQSQKVNAANAKINALNGQLTETSKSLSKVIESYTSVSSLGKSFICL